MSKSWDQSRVGGISATSSGNLGRVQSQTTKEWVLPGENPCLSVGLSSPGPGSTERWVMSRDGRGRGSLPSYPRQGRSSKEPRVLSLNSLFVHFSPYRVPGNRYHRNLFKPKGVDILHLFLPGWRGSRTDRHSQVLIHPVPDLTQVTRGLDGRRRGGVSKG